MQPSIEINTAKAHWLQVLPGEPLPGDDQWAIWRAMHRPAAMLSAITQTAIKRKKTGGEMTGDRLIRFASAVMTRLSREASTTSRTEAAQQ